MDRNDVERMVNVEQGIQRLESKLDLYLQGINKDITDVKDDVGDHRDRIRALEKWAWSIPPSIVLSIIALVGVVIESGIIGG